MYNKIDIFFMGKYVCSTNDSKNCMDARRTYITRYGIPMSKWGLVKAFFDRVR